MSTIRWSPRSAEDLQAIYDFVARDSRAYARLVAARIVEAADRLREFPESGRVVPEVGDPSLREVIVPPFRIVYRLRADTVEIVTVFRASRLFPDVAS